MYYRLNEPDVIQETVDGETLIVHTRMGIYFSLQGCGTQIWNALLEGHSIDHIVDCFDASDAEQREAVFADVESFIGTLLREQLLLPAHAGFTVLKEAAGKPPLTKLNFVRPELQIYTDMQELLLVDPIHEVDPEAGWPVQKDSGSPV